MAKGYSLNRQETIKEGISNHQEGRTQLTKCGWIQWAFLKFSKLCLMVEAKILTLTNVVLNVCKDNKTIIYWTKRVKRQSKK